ncbi:MAG: M3 family peptidase [Opitutaceae bacterium]|nr:M3 family peptidase [Opitutaceae bacterium]
MDTNPLLDSAFAIRWSRLTPELIAPGIAAALARAQAAIEAISAQDEAAMTYDSTFLALERATEELNFAWGKVSHLQGVADSPALRKAHNAMLPKVSAFYAKIPLSAELWRRLKAYAGTAVALSLGGIHRRFLDETVADFKQAGADLPADRRSRLEVLQSELAQITQKFSENVLDATNAWQLVVDDEARLAGLPPHAKAAAQRSAESKGLGAGSAGRPVWRFTLHLPSQEPVMTYAEDEALRREMWSAATEVGAQAPYDNTELIRRIIALRAEKASLLGKPHFADLMLERRMAKSATRALAFIEDLRGRVGSVFARECRELEEFKARELGRVTVGRRERTSAGDSPETDHLKAWEIGFWAEKLRKARYDFDQEELRPYLPMDRVIAGLFELAGRVFGLRITEKPAGAVETWHPEVRFYDMHDARGRPVGSFYADWHPRESKRGGAWMGYLITGGPTASGGRAPHLGYICGNLTLPADSRPALLTHREVETIFHEFGHLLHHLLGEVAIKSLNGVNVAWDFVELPSQLMENWCWERESLDLFARHHETGAPIPEGIFQKMTAAKNFRSACAMMRQVQLAKLDLLLHVRMAEFLEGDIEAKARATIADCMIPTEPPAPTAVKRFTHIFADPVGYAAGYYSYKWAELLDADAFTRFRSEGIFNARVGLDFVDKILSRGNSADPAELYRSFMGREPDLQALLVRAGLAG